MKLGHHILNNFKALVIRPASHTPSLDGFRALSIIWVVVFHIYWMSGLLVSPEVYEQILASVPFSPIMNGTLGVDTFFVMSGFLIAGQLFREYNKTQSIGLKTFYLKRAFRLLPVYYLVLVIMANVDEGSKNVWANFIYINNLFPVQETTMPWSWSLAIEEQFYVVFPLFALWLLKQPKHLPWLLILLLGAFGINHYVFFGNTIPDPFITNPTYGKEVYDQCENLFYVGTHLRFGSLLIGIIASYIHFFHKAFISRVLQSFWGYNLLGTFGFFLIGLTTFVSDKDVINSGVIGVTYAAWYHYLFSLGLGLFMLLTMNPRGMFHHVNSILSIRAFYPIAQLSYSLYLIHPIVIYLTYESEHSSGQLTSQTLTGLVPMVVLICLVSSMLLYVFIEKPFIQLRKRFDSKDRVKIEKEIKEESYKKAHDDTQ